MYIWKHMGLRARIFLTLGALILITAGGGVFMIWYTYRVEALFMEFIQTDVASLQVAKGLEKSLLNQRGSVSYYLLEKDPAWLKELGKYRQSFEERLKEAKQLSQSGEARAILESIELEYLRYASQKDRVIEYYRAGEYEAGAELHEKVRGQLVGILNLVEQYSTIYAKRVETALARDRVRAARLRFIAVGAMSAAVVLGGLLFFVLVTQILEPIRQLAFEADRSGDSNPSSDDVRTLKDRVHGLIENADQTQMELEWSRKRLLQSEKMAVVGKLAAEVAHSIRNPMTSIKMRLFSLERALVLEPEQKEDLDVISDEMRQLDNIVQNFLEFSRPPKLRIHDVDVSEVANMAIQLLQKQIERHNVKVKHESYGPLPVIKADSELLKEVVVNLIVNACEAMEDGGTLTIIEREAIAEHVGRAVLIQLTDTGPGIPKTIQDRVFEPFFSSKDEGTGLGLAIATRIVEEHGGRLSLRSEEGKGATFEIMLPVPEEQS